MTSMPIAERGLFVSFEGGEGAGKSTQIAHLARRLEERGLRVVVTREPGGSDKAERIRSILLSGQAKDLGSHGESMLFAAARQDHVETLIAPALAEGAIVLCDRFVDSTRVYQGAVAGLDQRFLGALEAAATGGTMPDLTLVIDVPAELGLERARLRRTARGEAADRFEAEGAAYHAKVRDAFLTIAAAEPSRCTVIDGGEAPDRVAEAVWAAVAPHLDARAGQGAAAAALREGETSGRLHHAWLIGGPEGIGKATLAYRFARHLLAPPGERLRGADGFGVDPASRTARQVAALSHPNLVAVERAAAEEGKAEKKIIGVDAVRKALAFFASTAADGGRRVCIVDSVDDLNIQAANALLKTIEEPPPGALILLVSHAPRRVLPTIRSRCRKLDLPALTPDALDTILADLAVAEPELRRRVAEIADGSVRRALTLLDPRRIGLIDELRSLLDSLPKAPPARVLSLAEKVGDRRAAEDFPIVLDTVQRWLSDRIGERPEAGAARLAPLAEVCENLTEAARAVEVYNLDRRAFIVSTFGDLADAVRRAA